MSISQPRGYFGRALAGSTGIHVLVALLIPALAWTASTAAPVETISFVQITHVEIATPKPVRPAPRPAAPVHRPAATVSEAIARPPAKALRNRPTRPSTTVVTALSSAATYAQVVRIGAGTSASAAPAATATPAARAVASVGTHEGGYMPFGAEQPVPVLDPDVLHRLTALATHVTLIVTVGDDGRTKNVVFQPPLDPQLQARIESLLADASWDPAVCGGGITCQGQATIRL